MEVAVLLSGRLRLDGYGRDKPANDDGTFSLSLKEGSTVREVIRGMGVPGKEVAVAMVNSHKCDVAARVKANDRVILIPRDVAVLWGALGRLNMGADSVCDF
jgi:hypothetical protein